MLPCCVVLIKILERETHFLGYLYFFSSSQISFEKFCTLRSLPNPYFRSPQKFKMFAYTPHNGWRYTMWEISRTSRYRHACRNSIKSRDFGAFGCAQIAPISPDDDNRWASFDTNNESLPIPLARCTLGISCISQSPRIETIHRRGKKFRPLILRFELRSHAVWRSGMGWS